MGGKIESFIEKTVKELFELQEIYLDNAPIVFVCGAKLDQTERFRYEFLRKCEGRNDFRLLIAEHFIESFFTTSPQSAKNNLSKLEEYLGEISECILLFPESVGSYCELGYFSGSNKLIKKLLVANDITYQPDDSFLNNGLIRAISLESEFRLIQLVKSGGTTTNMEHVIDNIISVIKPKRKKKFDKKARYSDYNLKEKMFLIFEIINLCKIVEKNNLQKTLGNVFNTNKQPISKDHKNEFEIIIPVLESLGMIDKIEDSGKVFYFAKNDTTEGSFFNFGRNTNYNRINVISEYYDNSLLECTLIGRQV